MTLFDIFVFLAVYCVVFWPCYLLIMSRHKKKMDAIWAEQTKRMEAIWGDHEQRMDAIRRGGK